MKILKILLFFLGLFIFVLGTDAYLGVDDVIMALNEAVELDAPVILPENEGKIVILHGVPEMTAPVYDEELGLTLHTVKAMRYKESYDLVSRDDGECTVGLQVGLLSGRSLGVGRGIRLIDHVRSGHGGSLLTSGFARGLAFCEGKGAQHHHERQNQGQCLLHG